MLFTLGVLASVYKFNIMAVELIFAIIALTALFFKRKILPFLVILTISFFAGSIRMNIHESHREEILRQLSSREMTLTMTVTDFSFEGKATAEFTHKGKIRKLQLKTDESTSLYPGDIIKADVYLYAPYTSKTDISDYSMYLASNGIYLCGKAESVEKIGQKSGGIDGAIFSVRRYIDSFGGKHFSGDIRGLFNAMMLGDKRFISDEFSASMQMAGLSHIAVVSGMHLSIIIALQMMIINKLFGKKRWEGLLCVAGAVFITVITGAGASVLRALAMCAVFSLAKLFRRENDSLTSLMLTVIIMLSVNPYLIFNAGFVLSVASVMGIILYGNKMKALTENFIGGPAGEAISICLSAQLTVTVPVMYYFGMMTPYAIISNLAVTVFATLIVISSILFTCFSAIPLMGAVISFAVKFSGEALGVVSRFVESLPGAALETGVVKLSLVAGWVFLLGVLSLKKSEKRKIMGIFAMSAVIFFSGACFEYASYTPVKLNFISYGGESVTAAFFEGEALLIDCPDSTDAINMAENNGIDGYNCTVITKPPQSDVLTLVSKNKAGKVIAYSPDFSEKEKAQIIKDLADVGAEPLFLERDQRYIINGISVGFIHTGDKEIPAPVEIEYKGLMFVSLQNLSTAEIKGMKEKGIYIPCDYMKVASGNTIGDNELKNITDGQILKDEKTLSLNLK